MYSGHPINCQKAIVVISIQILIDYSSNVLFERNIYKIFSMTKEKKREKVGGRN